MIARVPGRERHAQPFSRSDGKRRSRRQSSACDRARPALRRVQLRERRQRHGQRREGHAGKLGLDVLALEGALDLPEDIVEPAPVAALLPRVRQHRQRVAIPRIKFQRALQRGLAVGMAPLLNVKRAEVQPHLHVVGRETRGFAVAFDRAAQILDPVLRHRAADPDARRPIAPNRE